MTDLSERYTDVLSALKALDEKAMGYLKCPCEQHRHDLADALTVSELNIYIAEKLS